MPYANIRAGMNVVRIDLLGFHMLYVRTYICMCGVVTRVFALLTFEPFASIYEYLNLAR